MSAYALKAMLGDGTFRDIVSLGDLDEIGEGPASLFLYRPGAIAKMEIQDKEQVRDWIMGGVIGPPREDWWLKSWPKSIWGEAESGGKVKMITIKLLDSVQRPVVAFRFNEVESIGAEIQNLLCDGGPLSIRIDCVDMDVSAVETLGEFEGY